MEWWAWLILGIVLLLSEVLTPGAFFLLFFGLGACAISAIRGLGVELSGEIQWTLFSVFGLLNVIVLRPFILRVFRGKAVDAIDRASPVDEFAFTSSTIPAGGEAQIEFRGTQWRARNVSDVAIASHARVRIVKMDGLVLEVVAERN